MVSLQRRQERGEEKRTKRKRKGNTQHKQGCDAQPHLAVEGTTCLHEERSPYVTETFSFNTRKDTS